MRASPRGASSAARPPSTARAAATRSCRPGAASATRSDRLALDRRHRRAQHVLPSTAWSSPTTSATASPYTDPESDTVTVEPAGIVDHRDRHHRRHRRWRNRHLRRDAAHDPAGNVDHHARHPDGQVTTSSPTLSFTPANWNIDQTVTVTAFDDAFDEVPDPHTGTITHVAASPGNADYDGLVGADVVANVTDDDGPALRYRRLRRRSTSTRPARRPTPTRSCWIRRPTAATTSPST